MSLDYLNAAWDAACDSPTEKLVLLAIARHADNATGEAWPSVQRISEMCSITERCVYTTINKLEIKGLVSIKAGGGRGKCNAYVVKLNPERRAGYQAKTLNGVHKNPERRSVLHNKGTDIELRGAPRWESHIRKDIEDTKERMNGLKIQYTLWNSMEGTRWTSAEKRTEYERLKNRLGKLDKELFSLAAE